MGVEKVESMASGPWRQGGFDLAMPDDGVERWLIRGKLREKPMTVRNHDHSRIMAQVTQLLGVWLDGQPAPRGQVLCGEAGCRLRRTPESVVGIDVASISAELAARSSAETTLIDGPPILAVEILSPNEVVEEIEEKIDEYRAAGVALVWLINPRRRTVQTYRAAEEPEMVNIHQELTAESPLPGFRVRVAGLFA
jgi:Uma2 family endonuclease